MSAGVFDVLFGNLVGILKDYSKNAPPGERFAVKPDMSRFERSRDVALVAPYIGSISAETKTAMGPVSLDVDYMLPLIVLAQGSLSEAAEEAAGVRMRRFEQQMLEALFGTGNYDLGLPEGSISKKDFRFNPTNLDDQRTERILAASMLTLEIGLTWTPEPQAGTPVSEIHVDVSPWEALFKEEKT